MKKNTEIAKEIKSVEKLIKKDLSKEKIISGLYKYIFKSSGKKIRAKLSLISSLKRIFCGLFRIILCMQL